MIRFVFFVLALSSARAELDTADLFGHPLDENKWMYKYSPLREKLHERIISQRLEAGESDPNPRLIFYAGAFGAGKSYLTGVLERFKILDVDRFLWVDPDPIKEEIPEYEEYKARDPESAATLVHRESGHIQVELVERALKARKNIIIDGSLRARDWWLSEFARIRETYPEYSISIFYVTAGDEQLLERVRERAKITGRHIPDQLVLDVAREVEDSVQHLRTRADFFVKIENVDAPTVKSILHRGVEMPTHLNLFGTPPEAPPPAATATPSDFDKVVVLAGYGHMGYEDYSLLRSYVTAIAARYSPNTLFVISSNEGIGRARRWLKSSAVFDSAGIERLFDDETLAGRVEVFALRGGPRTVRVIEAARRRGVPVTLVRDRSLEPVWESLALRLMREPSFPKDATRTFALIPDGVNVVRTIDRPDLHRVYAARTKRLRRMFRAIEATPDREIVKTALATYPELTLLTEGTIANPEAAAGREPPPRAIELPADFGELRPHGTVLYPAPIAEVPENLENSLSRAYFGKAYPEFDRTISMLLMFKRLLAGDYDGFVLGQPAASRLTRRSFDQLVNFMRMVAYDPSTRDALFSFLIFNNVGKAKPVIEYLRDAGQVRDFNHQRIMARTLEAYGFVSPTYQRLDETQHHLILSAFEREFALGQHTQGELPARFLAEYARRTRAERDFYLATFYLKAAAGRGHVKQLGALVMTEPMYRGARAAIETLEQSDGSQASVERAYQDFLEARARTLMPPNTRPWLTRVALMLRSLTPEEGQALATAAERLPAEDHARLERELTAGGFGSDDALLLYYATAVFDNLRKVTPKEELAAQALHLLARVLEAARRAVGSADGVTQVRLDPIATSLRLHGAPPEGYAVETFQDDDFGLSVRLVTCQTLFVPVTPP